MTDILEVLAKTPQFILLLKIDFQSFLASNLCLLHFGHPIFETPNKVFQLSSSPCFISKFLGPFLVLVVNIYVIGIQLTLEVMFLS